MRELKFRAWWKDTKRFLDGDEWYMACSGAKYLHYAVMPYNDDDFIIEQYTGLKDKNGKEIYEGDIVEKDGLNYWIKWEKGCFVIWRGERYISFVIGGHAPFCKVIGNINENPELLEKQ